MSKIEKKTAARIEKEMFDLFISSGPKTKDDLLALGFTQDEIDTHGPAVARRLREAELA